MATKSSALPLVAGGAALLFLSSGKKKKKKTSSAPRSRWGVKISKDCSSVEIVDPDAFQNFILGAYMELVDVDSSLSLIQITDALFGEVAPDCSGFPENPESEEIAELYAVIARNLAPHLAKDPRTKDSIGSLIDETTNISFTDWYRAWRNYPSAEVPDGPSGQVVFSSDMTDYAIGDSWFEEFVRPFVQKEQEDGRLEFAFDDFVNNIGVKVGRFMTPINELPQEAPTVQDFLAKLASAIQRATDEVFKG